MDTPTKNLNPQIIRTGVTGLDDILRGGLTGGRLYLLEGQPGSGKTTLAIQFLMAGRDLGEKTLYVTLSETRAEIEAVAASHGWSLENIVIHEMVASEESLDAESQLTMFHPSELELGETTRRVLEEVERIGPQRVVFDSLSEMRLLAQNALRYRRQILGLKQFFAGRNATIFLLDDCTGPGDESQLQSIAHGGILLEKVTTGYGVERRRLMIRKMRGIGFRGGYHDFVIKKGGIDVFPRLVAAEHHVDFPQRDMPSGNAEFDRLLVGGIPTGSSTLLVGPAGVGKSTVGLQMALTACSRGERSALFIFDETVRTLMTRARGLNMPIDTYVESGLMTIQQVDPSELSPGEFASIVRSAADGSDPDGRPAAVIMIDSLNGYLHSMSEEQYLTAQLHELFTFLNQRGVITVVCVTQSGMIGTNMRSPADTTYLADNVILFRFFEAAGRIRRAISVAKKRVGAHESTIREFRFTSGRGIEIGQPLSHFHGLLTGTPTYVGDGDSLIPHEPGEQLAIRNRDGAE